MRTTTKIRLRWQNLFYYGLGLVFEIRAWWERVCWRFNEWKRYRGSG